MKDQVSYFSWPKIAQKFSNHFGAVRFLMLFASNVHASTDPMFMIKFC